MQAWDTLFWFAVLVGMSGQLNSSGVISHFADIVGGKLTAMNMGWQPVFGLLNRSLLCPALHVCQPDCACRGALRSLPGHDALSRCAPSASLTAHMLGSPHAPSAMMTTAAMSMYAVVSTSSHTCRLQQECCCSA